MAKTVDSRQNALDRLRALRAEKPATQMGQIRWAWPEISTALSIGHSLTTVHQRLHEVGIEIPYKRLSLYIGRLRREGATRHPVTPHPDIAPPGAEAQKPTSSEVSPLPTASEPTGNFTPEEAPGHDPLANLRKYANTRPGFHWDEAPPDIDKLF